MSAMSTVSTRVADIHIVITRKNNIAIIFFFHRSGNRLNKWSLCFSVHYDRDFVEEWFQERLFFGYEECVEDPSGTVCKNSEYADCLLSMIQNR